jgi:hypothetical protein
VCVLLLAGSRSSGPILLEQRRKIVQIGTR